MNKARPEIEYYHTHDKRSCKICRKKLRQPSKSKTVLSLLYNRALCSADCLFVDYDSLDNLTDEFIEYADYLEERVMPLDNKDYNE